MTRKWTAFLTLLALLLALTATGQAANDPGQAAKAKVQTDRDQVGSGGGTVEAQASTGIESYSPGDSIAESDEEFVADSYGSLDSYTFRSGGPIRFPIKITRYFGPVDGSGHLEHPENIDGGTALLTLRVWDVDQFYPGPEAPEVDRVYINGNEVGTLSGANDQWSTFTVEVPVDQLKFPTYDEAAGVQPAENWVEVYIDTANVGVCECWAVTVDWGRLVVKGIRPAVLVHGFMSSAGTWSAWESTYGPNSGLPVRAFSFGNNHGSWLAHAFEEAGEIATAKQKFGVQKLNVVGHSKGGLDTRAYLALGGTDVNRLVMLGTPNGGSPLADIVKAGGILNGWIGLVSLIGEPALTELTVTYMNLIGNNIVGPNPNTAYYTVAGDYRVLGLSNPLIWGPDDGVVAVSSVETLPYTSALGHTSSFHTGMTSGQAEWNYAKSQIVTTQGLNGFAAPTPINLTDLTGQTLTGGSASSTVNVAAGSPVTLGILWGQGNLNLTLTSPSGMSISGNGNGVEMMSNTDPAAGISYILYRIAAPEAGAYTLNVTGDPAATINYLTVGAAEDGILLSATPASGFVRVGDQAVIQASLSGPVSGTVSMTAHIQQPGGQVDTVALTDNGSGTFTGSYPVTGADGFHSVVVTAQSDTGFARIATTGFQALSSADRFTGTVTHQGVDTSGDGLFDQLVVRTGVSVAAGGTYLVTGQLTDASGRSIVRTATQVTLPAGAPADVALSFDGGLLGESGFTGDLTLTDLTLIRADGNIADYKAPAATISGYNYRQFQRDALAVLPGIAERPVDTNGDRQYEYLYIDIPVDVLYAGYYDLNARLMDGAGGEIEWAKSTVYLTPGQTTVTLAFTGETIGKHGVDGPYYIRDFSMYNLYVARVGVNIYDLHTTMPYDLAQFQGYEDPESSFDGLLTKIAQFADQGLIANQGLATSLRQKVESARAAAERGQTSAARNVLGAVLDELAAQSGQQIDAAAAAELTKDVEGLMGLLP